MRKLLLVILACALVAGAAPAQTAKKATSPRGEKMTHGAKRIIYPPDFRPNMPFSPGVMVGSMLFVAGQTGGDLKTGKLADTFEGEVRQTLENIGVILKAAGMDYSNVVNVTVYLTDISKFPDMNKVYTEFFKEDRPARATVQVAKLVGNAQIEISAIAHK